MLIVDLRTCSACGVEVDFYCQIIAVLVDVGYSVREIKRCVIVDNVGCAGVALERLAYVLADFAANFKLLIVSAECAAVIAAFC